MRLFKPSHQREDSGDSEEASRRPGFGAWISDAFRHFSGLARTLLLIGAVGAVWLAWDVVSEDEPAIRGDRFDQIDAYVADQRDDSRIPGASVAVIEDGAVVHARGFGNDGHGNQVTPDTPFWIGSNTKSITALAVMQLAEAGSIDLDAPVRDYLPDFAVADDAASAQITVRHLLNQTSGISRRDGLWAVVNADRDQSIQDVVSGMADLELNRPVGERFEYANLNSVVLGAVIEAVTGQTWQDYVQANIFDPLAMTNTYTDKTAAEAAGLTATHRFFFGFPVETDGDHFPGLAPTGYVYTSAADLARYLAMYTNGGLLDGQRVLSDAGITEMLSPATNERTFTLQNQQFAARYGAGWFVGTFGAASDARWHQGSLPYFTTWMVLLPDTNQAVVVMINAGNQFEIGGANAAWSRSPQGVVNLLRDADPPTGTSTGRFFIIFDTLVAIVIVAQAWTLARLIARPRSEMAPTVRRTAPLLGELIVAPLVLLVYPAITGGLGWRAAFTFIPDLSLTVATVAGLAVVTGTIRAVRLGLNRAPSGDEVDRRTPPKSASSTSTDVADPDRPSTPMRQHQ
ncbi:MAG: serine hydrolase domain-containing protein [Acidimicrobiales bacterium]